MRNFTFHKSNGKHLGEIEPPKIKDYLNLS